MDIIGQFNLGFILARLRDDLYIIDQHATDEKFRFETLQRTTVMRRQPLIVPLPLELTAGTECTIVEHRATFERNGFGLAHDESAPPGQQLRLTAVPFSKNKQFGVADVHELAALCADEPIEAASSAANANANGGSGAGGNGQGGGLRLPRVLAMFASRACRSAIMIGDALDHAQMRKVR